MNLEQLTLIDSRIEGFAKLIKHFDYKIGIEIGVREAHFSQALLENTKLEKLIGLDWKDCPNAVKLEEEYKGRYKFHKGLSPEFSIAFDKGYFDFIHIDADHRYLSVQADLECWFSRLKSGGCLSGDDYMQFSDHQDGEFGVMRAVNEFCTDRSLQLYIINFPYTDINKIIEYGTFVGNNLMNHKSGQQPFMFSGPPNWYLIKP